MDKNDNPLSKYQIRYPEWLKRKACQEFLIGGQTKKDIQEKYGVRGHGRLLYWLKELGYICGQQPQPCMPQEPENISPEQLQKRIKELEDQLEKARLKAEGYELMIELAEKELKIPIKKKSATK